MSLLIRKLHHGELDWQDRDTLKRGKTPRKEWVHVVTEQTPYGKHIRYSWVWNNVSRQIDRLYERKNLISLVAIDDDEPDFWHGFLVAERVVTEQEPCFCIHMLFVKPATLKVFPDFAELLLKKAGHKQGEQVVMTYLTDDMLDRRYRDKRRISFNPYLLPSYEP